MRENGLLEKVKRFKPERPWKRKPVAKRSNQYWGTDMTKFLISGVGWVSLVIVEDWFHRQAMGHAIGLRGDTTLWLEALNEAVQTVFPQRGSRGEGVDLISNNGSQPTSRRYRGECKTLGIGQIFTTYDNPRGNAETERLIRTLKEEAIWPYELIVSRRQVRRSHGRFDSLTTATATRRLGTRARRSSSESISETRR
jgi:putative transposase